MDSITHLALGAAIGEVMMGKTLGKKALAIGALAQFLPDADVVASLWLDPAQNLLAHRGITHSFLFASISGVCMAWLANRLMPGKQSFSRWSVFFCLQLFIHAILDACNAYGVGWFEPFHDLRVSYNVLFVADPLLTLPLIIVVLVLIIMARDHSKRKVWAVAGLACSTLYFSYAAMNKITINEEVKSLLAGHTNGNEQFITTPTPLNSMLWYVVVEGPDGFYTGYRSVFDRQPTIPLEYFPKQDSLLRTVQDQEALAYLQRFSQGYYIVEDQEGSLIFNDLRFGQIAGWHNSRAPFTFHFYLDAKEENKLVMQRGRFSNWNRETTQSLIERIMGN